MRHLLTFLFFAASAFAQTATITDTIATPFAGTFSGTVTVSLNSPALAQPLYSGSVTLSGWTQAVTVTAGVFSLTLYTNDLITPGGTSYTATYAPTSGSGWKETWIVPSGATTIREIRSTTVPSPSVRFTPSQITQAGATLGQGLKWDGSKWAPADVVANPMTTNGDLITRLGGVPVRVGIGSTNQVLTVSGGMPVWASGITGNASTASALAANGTNCSAGSYPLGVDASGNAEACTAAVTASTGLSDSADIVRGGASLATVGSVPFVTSSGVLGQNTNFRFFNGTGNLVVGTTTDDGANRLQVAGSIRLAAAGSREILMRDTNGSVEMQLLVDTASLNIGVKNVTNLWSINSSGTNTLYNQTPTTGSTSLVVRAGAGQGSNAITTWQDSSGVFQSRIQSSGGFQSKAAMTVIDSGATVNHIGMFTTGLALASNVSVSFSSTTEATATKDLSLSRASANVLQVGDGSANSNGTILARIHTWANGSEGTCDATLRGQVVMVQGGAGVADTFRICRKDAANAYAWTALY